jgi:Flp pilus assembly protein TadD
MSHRYFTNLLFNLGKLTLVSALLLPCAHAQANSMDTLSAIEQLYQEKQYQSASELGLAKLLEQPWNHDLRFLVADSLQRLGQYDAAIVQFEALEGTAYSQRATLRVNAIRTNTPPAAPIQLTGVSVDSNTESIPIAEPTPVTNKPAQSFSYTLLTPVANSSPHSARQQRIYDLYAAGNYQDAGTEGMQLLSKESSDDELRMNVANSLAWSGRMDLAAVQYRAIGAGRYYNNAQVGLANLYRWRGRDDQSLALYQDVLRSEPDNPSALQGLQLAQRFQ